MSRECIPVLMYHAVHNQRSPISITPQDFRQHMRWLKEQGIQVLSAGSLLEMLGRGKPLPAKAVVLTFDDGYENLFWNVYPVLSEFDFTATVFLVSGFCGKLNHWANQPGGIPSLKLLNWRQIREMDGKCIEFGAHSVSHQHLDRLSEIELDTEILQSKTDIEDNLGGSVNVFAYPYGAYNTQVKAATARSFDGAFGTAMGYVDPDSDPFLLERIDVYYFQQPVLFQRLFSPSGKLITGLLRRYRKIRSYLAEPDGF